MEGCELTGGCRVKRSAKGDVFYLALMCMLHNTVSTWRESDLMVWFLPCRRPGGRVRNAEKLEAADS